MSPDRAAAAAAALLIGVGCAPSYPALPSDGSPGTYSASFTHDGVRRSAVVYAPESIPSERAPVLLAFHGYGGTSRDFMESADLRPHADEAGFLLVYPQGSLLQGSPHWNSAAPSEDNKSDADDFGFVDRLLDTVADAYDVDPERVYAAGYSNGGMMAFGLACYGDRFAAVASVSGAMLDDIGVSCTPPRPTSVLTMHGTSDGVLPYDGAEGMASVEATLGFWTGVNGITAAPETSATDDGGTAVETSRFLGGVGGTEVEHHRVIDGGHVWFDLHVGGANTNDLVWGFLSRFDRDGAL